MFAVYRIPKDAKNQDYSIISEWFNNKVEAFEVAQMLYEKDSSYTYEVRDRLGRKIHAK